MRRGKVVEALEAAVAERCELAVVLGLLAQNQLGKELSVVSLVKMGVVPVDISGDTCHFTFEFMKRIERVAVPAEPQAKVAEGSVVGAQMGIIGTVRGNAGGTRAGMRYERSVTHDRTPIQMSEVIRLKH